MVTRHYICDNCGNQFALSESIKDPPKRQCPQCKKFKLYQDLTGGYDIIIGEPTTLGQQAERNTKAMGKYGLELQTKLDRQKYHKRKIENIKKLTGSQEDLPKPWYNPDGDNLVKEVKDLNKDQRRKYIQGE